MWPELVCPEDGSSLSSSRGETVCARGHRWPIRLGIPRMVPRAMNYCDSFGLQWKRYRRTQLDSHTKTTISRERARRCIGPACWEMLRRPERTDVLEVGCGAGRFTEVLLSTKAFVTSIDMSDAVEANQENFPRDERHRIIQADVLRLPFPPGVYDVVFCLGVVQHTPEPEITIGKLYAQLKPGGWLIMDHYTHSLSYYTKSAPLFRAILRRMPAERGMAWTERLVNFFFPLHRAARKSRLAQMLLSRVSPLLTYYHSHPFPDNVQREWSLLDTHDSLTDRYKHFRTRNQVRRPLAKLGAEAIWCEYGGNGVEARCRKPSTGRAEAE